MPAKNPYVKDSLWGGGFPHLLTKSMQLETTEQSKRELGFIKTLIQLENLGKEYCKFQVEDTLGPVTLAPRDLPDETKRLVASVTARYSKDREKPTLLIRCRENGEDEILEVAPAQDEKLASWRIG